MDPASERDATEVSIEDTKTTASSVGSDFINLARETRDEIYALCIQDLTAEKHGKREGLKANSWTIAYTNAPANIDLLDIRLVSHQLQVEYDDAIFERLHLTMHLSILKDDIVSEALWHVSVPDWILQRIRGLKLVVSPAFDMDGHRFTLHIKAVVRLNPAACRLRFEASRVAGYVRLHPVRH